MKYLNNVDRAFVILKNGVHVATVLSNTSRSGTCRVTVSNYGKEAREKTAETLRNRVKFSKNKTFGEINRELDSLASFQTSKAGGYGYDKFTHALQGLVIDGVVISDDCGVRIPYPAGLDHFPFDFVPPAGYRTANLIRNVEGDAKKGHKGYSDCYRDPGLNFLSATGYQVIQVL